MRDFRWLPVHAIGLCRTLWLLTASEWLGDQELRIGLGCMRLSTDEDRDDERAFATIAAAAESGVTVFDTAHAYGHGASDVGHNERLLARALRRCGADGTARVVTKGGMTRAGDGWVPDGRAAAIIAGCETSLAALDGLAIDLFLIHAPDPRTPWKTSVRALARLLHEGRVRHVGLANVNRRQLDEALDLVEITAVEVALSVVDDRALRGGIVEHCAERGIAVIAHSPLGGPRAAPRLARDAVLVSVADAMDATPAEIALAWLLELSPVVIAIPGARHPETARSAARAARVRLDSGDRARLASRFEWPRQVRADPPVAATTAEVILVMGIPAAGKSRAAEAFVAAGYHRLNRDERGGSLRELSDALDDALTSGVTQIVLDSTYLTRAARSYVIEVAGRHGVATRCVWIDISLAQAQVNLIDRLLERFGYLPSPAELRVLSRREPGLLMPTNQMRALRELEPPSIDEGFATVERVPYSRESSSYRSPRVRVGGGFVAAAALTRPGWQHAVARGDTTAAHLVFDWQPGATADAIDASVAQLSAVVTGPVEGAVCPHPGGPPSCWCRPPLPGLLLAFARAHGIDTSRTMLVGTGPAHRTFAAALGAAYVPA